MYWLKYDFENKSKKKFIFWRSRRINSPLEELNPEMNSEEVCSRKMEIGTCEEMEMRMGREYCQRKGLCPVRVTRSGRSWL